MEIFQKSVIKNHLTQLDKEQVEKAFDKFKENYSVKKISEIKQLKEEEYQDGFLREIFVDVFGYTLKPADNYDLAREFKNQTDGKKADGAILKDGKAIVVIELKSTKTKDLKRITEQAFNYKNNQPECKYVITSNFQKLRFYIDYSNEYEEFDLFNLQKEEFELLYLLLHKDSIFADLPLKLKTETKFHEENISNKLYKDYSKFKQKIFENLVKNNLQYDKLTLFKKTQKFLDRLLFVFFAEDTGLVPPNAISKIIEQWQSLIDLDEYFSLYSRFVKFFGHLDKGHKYKTYDLSAYNGGLFAPDEILDNINIDDEILKDDALLLSSYDFSTDVDVNILGHIFEHSLGEIEEITAEIAATAATMGHDSLTTQSKANVSKRKKDGVFYTPKYITQYIVENTVGKLCTEKRAELNITEIEFDGTFKTKDGKLSAKGKKLFKTLENYKNWLITLKIIDPACGSGAFLNQALLFLIDEHKQIDDIIAELTGEAMRLFDTDKAILENNLYGVDINEESVEIAKLSLWLRTAQKGRKLSNLNQNIKCGNSLIDDVEIAGDKAFNWNTEFPQIFHEKNKKIWHITTATHNSRYSQRMFDNNVKTGEAEWIDKKDEIIITKTIAEIVKESKFDNKGACPIDIVEYNICGDHMHLLLVCEKEELTKIVGKIKSMTSRARNIAKGYTTKKSESDTTRGHTPLSAAVATERGETQTKLWTQKFGKSEIKDENYLNNAIEYIRNNRIKHELPENKEIEKLKKEFLCTTEHALRTEYNGGFDVVIGNPPYVQIKEKSHFDKQYNTVNSGDLYALFFEKGINILKNNGFLGFITPSSYMTNIGFFTLREYLLKFNIKNLFDLGANVFKDASVDSAIIIVRKTYVENNIIKKGTNLFDFTTIEQSIFKMFDNVIFNIYTNPITFKLAEKINNNNLTFGDYLNFSRGVEFGFKSDKVFDLKGNTNSVPILCGGNISKNNISFENKYINHDATDTKIYKSKDIYEKEKILIKRIGNTIIGTYDDSGFYNVCDVYNLQLKEQSNYKLTVLSVILNSKLLNFYYDTKFKSVKKLFPKIPIQNLKLLPLPKFEKVNQQPFIEKANQILDLNKNLQQKKNKFLTRLKDNFEIEKLSKKINTFYDFDFKILVSELKKQKIKLSLADQDEWEEYFNDYKTEINNLQTQINQTDKEIDQMVYQLYELTEEEIKIVEKSVN